MTSRDSKFSFYDVFNSNNETTYHNKSPGVIRLISSRLCSSIFQIQNGLFCNLSKDCVCCCCCDLEMLIILFFRSLNAIVVISFLIYSNNIVNFIFFCQFSNTNLFVALFVYCLFTYTFIWHTPKVNRSDVRAFLYFVEKLIGTLICYFQRHFIFL